MENIVKKIAIFSMIGMMQIGLGTSVIEASSRHNAPVPMQQQQDSYDKDKIEGNRHERERIENERHEGEMRRKQHESEREWRERQQREQQRHEENQSRIAHEILDLILDR